MESGLRLFDPEDGDDAIVRNFVNYLVVYMAQCTIYTAFFFESCMLSLAARGLTR